MTLRMVADSACTLNYPSNGVYDAVAVSSQLRSHCLWPGARRSG